MASFEPDLVVALAGAAVHHGVGTFGQGDLSQLLADDGTSKGSTQQILFIFGTHLQRGHDDVVAHLIDQIGHDQLRSASLEGLLFQALQLIGLANVAGDGDDLRVVIILFQPGDDDGSIQAAGICKYNFFDLIFVHRHDHKPPESICCVFLIAERIARFLQNCKQILHNHPNILRKNPVWFPQK